MGLITVSSTTNVVYTLAEDVTPPAGSLAWTPVDEALVRTVFSGSRPLARAFRRFLRRGCVGVAHVVDGRWLAYAWMTRPGRHAPPHLPRSMAQAAAYWIFNCRTREEARGRGLYRQGIAALVARARAEAGPSAAVVIDTELSNGASQRGILAAGFRPAGVLACRAVVARALGGVRWGTWDRERPHPPLPPRPGAAP